MYDWENDPFETHNLAKDPKYKDIKNQLKSRLHEWMIETRDLGLLAEAEYMIRSSALSPYEYARTGGDFKVAEILEAAEMVGISDQQQLIENLKHEESGVRYWGVIGLMQFDAIEKDAKDVLIKLLSDESPGVQIVAAEALCKYGQSPQAVETLGRCALDDRPWVALQAARSIQLAGEQARPLIPVMYEVLEKNIAGPGATHRKYKDFNYSAFTSWALEWALKELGEDITVN